MKRYGIRAALAVCISVLLQLFSQPAVQAAPGDFLYQWGARQHFSSPSAVTRDRNGNIYVADSSRVQLFNSAGSRLLTIGSFGSGNGQFEFPRGLATDQDGNLFVVDDINDRIEVFDSAGNFQRKWGSAGTGNGQFAFAWGIAIDINSGDVYVADSGNDRVQVFDRNGQFLRKWGSFGTGDGQFDYPSGIAVDSSGRVYVVDNGNFRVQVFDSAGNFLGKWGSYGEADGQFTAPRAITIDASSNVYVTDHFSRIQVFNTSGTFLRKWLQSAEFTPLGIVSGANGDLYVADEFNDRVAIFSQAGDPLGTWGPGSGDGQFDRPNQAAVDVNGNVYVADTENNRIEVFSNTGAFLRKWGSFGDGDGEFDRPMGVALDGKGNVYVVDRTPDGTRIQVFDVSGNFVRKWFGPSNAVRLTTDQKGNIWTANPEGGGVFAYDANGNLVREFGLGEPSRAGGIAVDPGGTVYVTDVGNQRINVFDNTGNFLRSLADGMLPKGGASAATVCNIALDPSGNLFVTDYETDQILVYDSKGPFKARWGGPGEGNGQFDGPVGVAVDLSGSKVFVTDQGNNRIQVLQGYGDSLPSGWIGRDVGSVGVAGRASYANGAFTLQGSGANIWGTSDGFHFVYKPLTGDGEIIARVTGVQNTNAYAKGGVMFRESLAANSVHAMVDIEATAGAEFSRRLTTGGSTTVTGAPGIAAPYWVKLVRQGSTFSGYISKDGSAWTLMGSSTIGMASTVYAGLIVNSHNNTTLCTTTIDSVSLTGRTNTPSVTITAPGNGASFTAPASINVAATATPSAGASIKQVDFFAGSTLIATEVNAPYSFTWSNAAAGSYTLTARVTDTFGGTATSEPVTITVNSAGLPAPWQSRDLGSVGLAGSASYTNGLFTVKGSGANIYGTSDAFRFVYQPMSGDMQIVARVISVQNTNTYAKAGVMIRQSLTANSAHAMMDLTPTSGAEFSRRATAGGSTTPTVRTGIRAPYWVKLVRRGSTFTGSISSDGATWSQVGSASISMSGTVYVGLIVNSHNNSVLCTGTFDSVSVTGGGTDTPPTVTAFSIPSTSSSLTVPITTFTAVDNVGVTGYLVTETSTRPSATASGWSATPPTSYTFATTGTRTLYAWAKDAAGNVSNSRSATVTISTGALPSPWLTQDIGSVGVIGSASYANGAFTLKGSGADIWGTADAFRFVYKTMTGDGQIIARVASLQNTNSYAKGGVMMRQSLNANSMHAMMDLRPTGGAEFSRRTSTGGTTSATTRAGIAAPYWVRLVRSGNTFTGYVSSNGTTWSQVGSATIGMTSAIYVGLIVNSHSNSVLCTTNIDAVK